MRHLLRSARGQITVVFCVGLLHAAAFALLTPAWQAPDEPGHVEYACLMAQLGRTPAKADRSPALQQAILASLARHRFWQRADVPTPDPLPATFLDDPFLARSGQQVGDEPPLFYRLPAALCRSGWPPEAVLMAMRLMGALLFGLAAAATAWAWQPSHGQGGAVPFALQHGLTVALLPMPAFIAGSANNDSLALFAATAAFAYTVRAQRLGWTLGRALATAALAALALASKKTALFLAPWLLWLALKPAAGRLVRSPRGRWALLMGLAAAAALAIALLLPSGAVSRWQGPRLWVAPPRVPVQAAADGWAALIGRDRATASLAQALFDADAGPLRGQVAAATAVVRSADGAPVAGRLSVEDTAGRSEAAFVADGRWQTVTVAHAVAETTPWVRLTVAVEETTGGLWVDHAALAPAQSPAQNLLRNPGFGQPAAWGEVLLAGPLGRAWDALPEGWRKLRRFLPPLASAETWTPQALGRYALYTALLFPGFWGNFGWLKRPLPIPVYVALAVVCAVALYGLVRAWPSRRAAAQPDDKPPTDWTDPARFAPQWLLAATLALLQALLPMLGRSWQPQGRYLFPALFPLTGLLLVGLNAALDLDRRPRRLAVALALLLALDVLSLLRAAFVI